MTEIQDIKAGLDAHKLKVTGLKTRATKLAATRDALIAQGATLEQTQTQALAELKELGIVPADLNPATLEALALKANADLAEAVAELEKTIGAAEALVNGNALAME